MLPSSASSREPLGLVGAARMRPGLLRERAHVLGVAAAQPLAVGAGVEPLLRELADRLEHREPLAVRRSEARLDELGERRRRRRRPRRAASPVQPPRKTARRAKQSACCAREQLVGSMRPPRRSVRWRSGASRRPAEYRQLPLEPVEQLCRRSSRRARGRELEGER